MTQTAINYAKVLYELEISKETVFNAKEIFMSCDELLRSLKSPVISLHNKEKIIEKIFPIEIWNYFKILCRYQSIGLVFQIFQAYEDYNRRMENVLEAVLYYVTPPDEEQKNALEQFLLKQFQKDKVEFKYVKDANLIGGFVIVAENREFDQSLRGRINRLKKQLEKR